MTIEILQSDVCCHWWKKDLTEHFEAADRDARMQTRNVWVRLEQRRSVGVDGHPGRDEYQGKPLEIAYGHE